MDTQITIPSIHVRFDGRSFDIPLNELDVGTLSPDNAIRDAVAAYLEVPRAKLEAFAIDPPMRERNEGTTLTLRPEAVFGYQCSICKKHFVLPEDPEAPRTIRHTDGTCEHRTKQAL